MLFSLAGDVPWSCVVHAYHRWASAKKLPYRSAKALASKVEKNGYSAKAVGEWLDAAAIAELLGITSGQIRRWIANGWIHGHHEGVKWYISRKALRDLAKRRPGLFQGRPATDLTQLLCDSVLAKELSERHERMRHGQKLRIRCVETGRTYESMAEAGRKVHVGRKALSQAMHRGRPCAGFHWIFVK